MRRGSLLLRHPFTDIHESSLSAPLQALTLIRPVKLFVNKYHDRQGRGIGLTDGTRHTKLRGKTPSLAYNLSLLTQ